MKELSQDIFDEEDRRQMAGKGIGEEQVLRQLAMFQRGAPTARLIRPAAVGDGINRFSERKKERYIGLFEETQRSGRVVKFLPASGAATRMFKTLLRFYRKETGLTEGDEQFLAGFLEGLKSGRFAFTDDLQDILEQEGLDLHRLLAEGQYHDILHYLLMPGGLNYANLPKALLSFTAVPKTPGPP